jgi:Protein of unknown function (DUF4089)
MNQAPMPHEEYVRAALKLAGYEFNDAQIAEITLQFGRIAALAATLDEVQLAPYFSAAPVFRP